MQKTRAKINISDDGSLMWYYFWGSSRDYSEFFEEMEQNGKRGIKLTDDKEVEDLIQQFRGYLALDVLLAFMNQRSVNVLGAYS